MLKFVQAPVSGVHIKGCWFFELYILGTSTVISGWVPTCASVQSCQLHGSAPLENHTASSMT